MNVGRKICVFQFTNAFVSNLNKLKNYGKVEMKRLFDRSFLSNKKKDPDDPDDDDPNSRKML